MLYLCPPPPGRLEEGELPHQVQIARRARYYIYIQTLDI